MPQTLVTLPLQLASFGLRLAWRAVELPIEVARALLDAQSPDGPPAEPATRAGNGSDAVRERPRPRPHTEPPEVIVAEPLPDPGPEHVDEGVELVAVVAEPGAEDGAGAELSVAEPWDGYAGMRADEIATRLREAGAAEAAAVELYEVTHKSRQSVLKAAERRLRDAAR